MLSGRTIRSVACAVVIEPYQKLGPPPASLQVTHTVARVSDKAHCSPCVPDEAALPTVGIMADQPLHRKARDWLYTVRPRTSRCDQKSGPRRAGGLRMADDEQRWRSRIAGLAGCSIPPAEGYHPAPALRDATRTRRTRSFVVARKQKGITTSARFHTGRCRTAPRPVRTVDRDAPPDGASRFGTKRSGTRCRPSPRPPVRTTPR